jgi:hypothetical protein
LPPDYTPLAQLDRLHRRFPETFDQWIEDGRPRRAGIFGGPRSAGPSRRCIPARTCRIVRPMSAFLTETGSDMLNLSISTDDPLRTCGHGSSCVAWPIQPPVLTDDSPRLRAVERPAASISASDANVQLPTR